MSSNIGRTVVSSIHPFFHSAFLALICLAGCNRGTQTTAQKSSTETGPRRFTEKEPPKDPKAGDLWVNPRDGSEMVFVPAGKFLMGSPKPSSSSIPPKDLDSDKNEQPQRSIELDAFWIARTEVTNEQFAKFVNETKHITFAEERGKGKRPTWEATKGKGSIPVVRVTRDDAAAYCKWAGGNLPTEAQWEKAARGADGRKYPWGNEWDAKKCANSVDKKLKEPQDVGTVKDSASPMGAYDMSGNVWEWVTDFYDAGYYKKMPGKNPTQMKDTKQGVIRGGSYATTKPERLRCAKRQAKKPYANLPDVGFRYARTR